MSDSPRGSIPAQLEELESDGSCDDRDVLENPAPAAVRSQSDDSVNGDVEHEGEPDTCVAMAMPRPPFIWPDYSTGTLVIALDSQTFSGPPSNLSGRAIGVHVGTLMGRLPSTQPEDCKMGAAICDRLSLEIPPEWLAKIFSLKKVSPDLQRAIQASLCGLLATTVAPFDFGAIIQTLGSFIHACPFFSEIVEDGKWDPPFGERTRYQIVLFGGGEPGDEPEADASVETNSASDRGEDQ